MASIINAATSGGLISTADTSGILQLQTAGTTAVTVNASQNMGVGTASPTARLQVEGTTDATQRIIVGGTGNTSSYKLNYNGSEVAFVQNYQNSEFQIGTTVSAWMGFNTNNTERMRIPAAGGVQAVSIISVGNATPASTGAGITFPASRSASTDANTLDDFEEGTWTPTCVSSSGTITTVGTVGGTYQIVGSRINAQGFANITTNGTGSGVIRLGGLPTNPSTNVVGYGTECSVTYKSLAVLKYTTSELNVAFYDHTYPGANGALLSVGYIDTAVF